MKKDLKKGIATILTVFMTMGSVITSYAGQWGFDGPENWKWWYQEDNATRVANSWKEIKGKWYHFDGNGYLDIGWHWIDGNNDGTAECYYLDDSGCLLINGTAPDGSVVNEDGAWVQNGKVQTRAAQQNAGGNEQYLTGFYESGVWFNKEDTNQWGNSSSYVQTSWERYNAWAAAKGESMGFPDDFWENYATINNWAQEDSTGEGALWKTQTDKYQIPMTLFDTFKSHVSNKITFRSQPGTEQAKQDIWNTIVFVMWSQTDGMASIADESGNDMWIDNGQFMTVNEDGSVTYTFYVKQKG